MADTLHKTGGLYVEYVRTAEIKLSVVAGHERLGLMKRSRSSLFLSYIPKLIISGSKEEPSEKLVFFCGR